MQWTVELPGDEGYGVVTTAGVFNVSDHARMIHDIVTRPGWRPGSDMLFDHRALDFSGADLRAIYQAGDNHLRNDEAIGSGRAAILVRSLNDYGRGRHFEVLTKGRVSATLHVFLDEAEARGWLAAPTG
jgi:hypothetical protein